MSNKWRGILRETLIDAIQLAYGDPDVEGSVAGFLTVVEADGLGSIEPVLVRNQTLDLQNTIFGYGNYEQAMASLDALCLLLDIAGYDYNPLRSSQVLATFVDEAAQLPDSLFFNQDKMIMGVDLGAGLDQTSLVIQDGNQFYTLENPAAFLRRFDIAPFDWGDEEE